MNKENKYLLNKVKSIGLAIRAIITIMVKEIPLVYWEILKYRITGKPIKKDVQEIKCLLWKWLYLSLCLLFSFTHIILKQVSIKITLVIILLYGSKAYQTPLFLLLVIYSILYVIEECLYLYYMSKEDFWEKRYEYMEKIMEKLSVSLFMPDEVVKKNAKKQVEKLEEEIIGRR